MILKSKLKHAVYYLCCYLIKIVSFVFFPCKAVGKENIPKSGPFIICPNHISMFDAVALNMAYSRPMRYMAKAELFENRLIGGFLSFFGAFPVNRGTGDKSAVENAEAMLRNDEPMCIFIEGTRTKNKDASPGKAKSGAVVIAHSVGCDIVPTAIVYKHGRPRIFSKTTVYFGTPIKNSELGDVTVSRESIRSAANAIMSSITQMWKAGTENCQK